MQRALTFFALSAALSACLNTGDPADDAVESFDSVPGDDVDVTATPTHATLLAAPAWQTPAIIASSPFTNRETANPRVVFDANGGAIAVWNARSNVYASHYVPVANSWSAPIRIGGSITRDGIWIGMDGAGNATVVWTSGDRGGDEIWANRFSAGSGWGTEQRLSTAGIWSHRVDLAVSANGTAIAVWAVPLSDRDELHARRYTGGAWQAEQIIDVAPGERASRTMVSIDGQGNAFAAWMKGIPVPCCNLRASRFVAASGTWGAPQAVASDVQNGNGPRLVTNTAGNAVAVWIGNDLAVHASRFANGSWGVPQAISPAGLDHVVSPELTVAGNAAGNVVAVWYESQGQTPLMASRFTPGSGWVPAAQVWSSTRDGALGPLPGVIHVALDAQNRAHLVWSVWDIVEGTFFSDVWASGNAGNGAWRAPQIISTNPAPAGSPAVAAGPSGTAAAVWVQGTNDPNRKLVGALYK